VLNCLRLQRPIGAGAVLKRIRPCQQKSTHGIAAGQDSKSRGSSTSDWRGVLLCLFGEIRKHLLERLFRAAGSNPSVPNRLSPNWAAGTDLQVRILGEHPQAMARISGFAGDKLAQSPSLPPFSIAFHDLPAVIGHHTWDHDEFVFGQEHIPERLLACAWDSRSQPIGLRNVDRANNMNVRHVDDMKRGQYVRQSVERFEAFVNRHFEYRGRWIKRAIHDANAFAGPPAADLECAFATILDRGKSRLIEAPSDELAASQWLYRRRHA